MQFGKAALDAVEAHWASDAKYCNSLLCKDYVEEALSPGLPFMYGCIEALDELGTIQVCATHNVPTLYHTLRPAGVDNRPYVMGQLGSGRTKVLR